jgi:rhodanese-related sulfurtransferase
MTRRVLAIVAIAGGVLAAFAGSPHRDRLDVATLASAIEKEEDHVTALELASWIRDRKPGLRIIHLGQEATEIPRAESMTLQSVVALPVRTDQTLVVTSDGGAHAAQAWVLLRARGHRDVYFLSGGSREWQAQVLNPTRSTELTRYFRRDGC